MHEPLFSDNWKVIIGKVSASTFCTGHNDRGWKADIDWLLNKVQNYIKVLEGKYDNKVPTSEKHGLDTSNLYPEGSSTVDNAVSILGGEE